MTTITPLHIFTFAPKTPYIFSLLHQKLYKSHLELTDLTIAASIQHSVLQEAFLTVIYFNTKHQVHKIVYGESIKLCFGISRKIYTPIHFKVLLTTVLFHSFVLTLVASDQNFYRNTIKVGWSAQILLILSINTPPRITLIPSALQVL